MEVVWVENGDQNKLVIQWLTNLIQQGILNNMEDIQQLFEEFPSIQKQKFDDSEFQELVYTSFKDSYLKNIWSYMSLWIDVDCKVFTFLTDKILQDQELQNICNEKIESAIKQLMQSAEISDDECEHYPDDRIRWLIFLESIYQKNVFGK